MEVDINFLNIKILMTGNINITIICQHTALGLRNVVQNHGSFPIDPVALEIIIWYWNWGLGEGFIVWWLGISTLHKSLEPDETFLHYFYFPFPSFTISRRMPDRCCARLNRIHLPNHKSSIIDTYETIRLNKV